MAFLIEHGRGQVTQVVDRAILDSTLDSSSVKQAVAEIRQKLDNQAFHEAAGNLTEAKNWKTAAGRQKSTLPGWIFSSREMAAHEWVDSKNVSHGVGQWRHQDWAHVNGLIMCDFDHIDDPRQVFDVMIKPKIKQLKILFVFITPSGHGLKVVSVGDANIGDISDNQKAVAKEIGLELDEVCFDASRLSFVTGRDDVLYLDYKILETENKEFIEKYDKKYYKGVNSHDMFGGNAVAVPSSDSHRIVDGSSRDGHRTDSTESAEVSAACDTAEVDYNYCGIAIPDIIAKLLPEGGVRDGKRHQTLYDTAKLLRYVCERSQKKVDFFMRQLQWVKDLDAEDGNVSRTIEDAMNKPYSSYMPKTLKNALLELGYKDKDNETEGDSKPYREWGERLQGLMDKFPCLREISYGLEPSMIPSALFVSAAFFGTLMTRTWYYFWYEPMLQRRLNYSIFVIGHPGSGKSFVGRLYKLIMEPIIVSDKIGNDAINHYKEELRARASSDKEKKKEALVYPNNIIRIHGARTANGVFIEDMVKAVEVIDGKPMHLHLFTFSAELDSITSANRGGQWIDKSNMELLAFHNEEDNQQYKNVDSVNGPFDVFWNFVYTGTMLSLSKKVNERNFGTGLFSRLGCVPIASDYFECASERKKTKAELKRDEELKKWAYLLDKVQGCLPLEPIVHDTHEFVKEIMSIAKIEENKADAFLVRRVPYYGINVSAPFILMRHFKEWEETRTFKCDKYDIELCRIAMEIQMHSQRHFFGKFAEMYYDDAERTRSEKRMRSYNSRTNDIFRSLKDDFDIEEVVKGRDITKNAARILVSRWLKDGLIKKTNNKKGKEKWSKVKG